MGLQSGIPARDAGYQNIQFIRKAFTFADDGSTLTVGAIPADARVVKAISGVYVDTVFNAGTTNVLDVGPSTDSGTDLWATDLALGTLGFVPLDEAVTTKVTVDTTVQFAVDLTGTAATTGAAEVVIAFIPPN
jgi:hypothetical protein